MDCRCGRRDRDLCVNVGAPIALSPKLLASSVARFFGKNQTKSQVKGRGPGFADRSPSVKWGDRAGMPHA